MKTNYPFFVNFWKYVLLQFVIQARKFTCEEAELVEVIVVDGTKQMPHFPDALRKQIW